MKFYYRIMILIFISLNACVDLQAQKDSLIMKRERESRQKDSLQNIERQKNYDDAIQKGDKAFTEKDWEQAIVNYYKALSIAMAPYPQTQIVKSQQMLTEEHRKMADQKKYDDLIAKADQCFAKMNFVKRILITLRHI